MADDIQFEIAGEIGRETVLANLVKALHVDNAHIAWSDARATMEEIEEHLVLASESGRPALFTKNDTVSRFEIVADACRNSELSYRKRYGPAGEEGYTDMALWVPGMQGDKKFDLDGSSAPSVSLGELKQAVERGIDAVKVLVKIREFAVEGFDRMKLAIEPALVEKLAPDTAPAATSGASPRM